MNKHAGLTSKQVAERQAAGLVNRLDNQTSRSIKDILRGNIVTPFNALITVLAIAILVANGNPINSLFFIAMLLNAVVGIIQELKAKAVLDKLVILVKPTAKVIRDGKSEVINGQEIVQDDLVILGLGDQILADGRIVWSEGLEIDESLLTGESDPVVKSAEDDVLSGSFVVAGGGAMIVTKVGEKAYSAKLASEARQFKRASSELVAVTNKIMRWIAWILVVVAPILIFGQLFIDSGNWPDAITHTVAAIVGMIPEGLVLLTSMAFLLAIVKLARQQVLIQQLPAVETLARVNTLLLDKTGTLTDGNMELVELVAWADKEEVGSIISSMVTEDGSATSNAIRRVLAKSNKLRIDKQIAFSSQRKWSAISSGGHYYVFGASEIVLEKDQIAKQSAETYASQGYRVLALVETSEWPTLEEIDGKILPLALIVLSEQIRADAAKTLTFFKKQGVTIKIISGDAAKTVTAIASQVGLEVSACDARKLPDPDKQPTEFLTMIRQHNVFGRVKPEQKRQIVAALQDSGDVVAMTGDGVNDALALKRADLGIAMSSGSAATKAVAEVVLMDNKFAHLPAVLAEGRRVAANIERVANLFIIKNVYTAILAIAVTSFGLAYPFEPAQVTIIGALSIGIPAFFLALAPNNQRYRPGFLKRVLAFSLPTGIVIAGAMFTCYYLLTSWFNLNLAASGTATSIVVMLVMVVTLIRLSRPIRGWKLLLILACSLVFAVCLTWSPLARLLSFELNWLVLPIVGIIAAIASLAIAVLQSVFERRLRNL